MLLFKNDVRLGKDTKPQLVLGLILADQVYVSVGSEFCWITSLADGQHKTGSKHYSGEAFDLRSKNLTEEQKTKASIKLKGKLRPLGFDVILEDRNGPREHFHIEWDPKHDL